jgi:hypothetical protein
MDARMGPIDVRFLTSTEPISRFLPGAGSGWWSHRLPKVLSDELAEDVARLHLREPSELSDDELETERLCVRCGKPVVRNLGHYETFEKMHWVCFHYEFEHSSSDRDASCGDPQCPARLSDPDAPPPWPSK